VDSWGFTLRVAQRLRRLAPGVKLIKLVGPQVWATRPGRARTLARAVDHLLAIHQFELPFYEGTGLPVTVVGNPALSREAPGDAAGFRVRHGLEGARLLLLLPGSRNGEIARVGPVMEAAAAIAAATRPDLRVVCVLAPAVADAVRARAATWAFEHLLVEESEKADAFAAADVALACSGTVTTEVAVQGTPVVVGYKLGWITWAIARAFLLKSAYVTLMNVAADAEVAPEYLQTRFLPATVARTIGALLDDPAACGAQVQAQNAALAAMGRGAPPAAQRAADAIVALLSPRG
jgi:lipid-A-disaccharide synthase